MKKYFAELLGTFVLVFFGCCAASLLGVIGAVTWIIAIALTFGLILTALCYTIGGISGCHVNPAVSLAMLINKKIGLGDFFGYIIAQFLGAIAASGLLKYILNSCAVISDFKKSGLGQNGYGARSMLQINVKGAIIFEVILTFAFVLTILGVTSSKKMASVSGVVIGLALVAVHLIGVPFTGTSVNPARSLGPAIFMGGDAIKQVWVFILAPLVGGALAAFTWLSFTEEDTVVIDEDDDDEDFEDVEEIIEVDETTDAE